MTKAARVRTLKSCIFLDIVLVLSMQGHSKNPKNKEKKYESFSLPTSPHTKFTHM